MQYICENIIVIEECGKSGGMRKFKNEAMNTADADGQIRQFSFHQTVPRPTTEDKNSASWNAQNWGPSIDISDDYCNICIGLQSIEIDCNTSDCCPYAWAITTAKLYTIKITINYKIESSGYEGIFVATPDGYDSKYTFLPNFDFSVYNEDIAGRNPPEEHEMVVDEIPAFTDALNDEYSKLTDEDMMANLDQWSNEINDSLTNQRNYFPDIENYY